MALRVIISTYGTIQYIYLVLLELSVDHGMQGVKLTFYKRLQFKADIHFTFAATHVKGRHITGNSQYNYPIMVLHVQGEQAAEQVIVNYLGSDSL